MPLTPRFYLSQTSSEVKVTVFVPTARLSDIEVLLQDSSLHFYASPYLLRLDFAPNEFDASQQGNVSARYDPDSQTVSIPLVKSHGGSHWKNLELIGRLLQPKQVPQKWLQSVQSTDETTYEAQDKIRNDDVTLKRATGYGFGNTFRGLFLDYCRSDLVHEMLQLSEPEASTPVERRNQRTSKEDGDFDIRRYQGDLDLEGDYLHPMVISFQPFWMELPNKDNSHSIDSELVSEVTAQLDTKWRLRASNSLNNHFTTEENYQLSTIPYPLLPERLLKSTPSLWVGLVDLLVPYVYDHMLTLGDATVESAWTVSTLSCSLSWLDSPTEVHQAVTSLTRRMLIYPYWRNFEFSMRVWTYTIRLLEKGPFAVTRCLLQLRQILDKSESFYLGNKLFVDPYLHWIQHRELEDPSWVVNSLRSTLSDQASLKHALNLGIEWPEVLGQEELHDDQG